MSGQKPTVIDGLHPSFLLGTGNHEDALSSEIGDPNSQNQALIRLLFHRLLNECAKHPKQVDAAFPALLCDALLPHIQNAISSTLVRLVGPDVSRNIESGVQTWLQSPSVRCGLKDALCVPLLDVFCEQGLLQSQAKKATTKEKVTIPVHEVKQDTMVALADSGLERPLISRASSCMATLPSPSSIVPATEMLTDTDTPDITPDLIPSKSSTPPTQLPLSHNVSSLALTQPLLRFHSYLPQPPTSLPLFLRKQSSWRIDEDPSVNAPDDTVINSTQLLTHTSNASTASFHRSDPALTRSTSHRPSEASLTLNLSSKANSPHGDRYNSPTKSSTSTLSSIPPSSSLASFGRRLSRDMNDMNEASQPSSVSTASFDPIRNEHGIHYTQTTQSHHSPPSLSTSSPSSSISSSSSLTLISTSTSTTLLSPLLPSPPQSRGVAGPSSLPEWISTPSCLHRPLPPPQSLSSTSRTGVTSAKVSSVDPALPSLSLPDQHIPLPTASHTHITPNNQQHAVPPSMLRTLHSSLPNETSFHLLLDTLISPSITTTPESTHRDLDKAKNKYLDLLYNLPCAPAIGLPLLPPRIASSFESSSFPNPLSSYILSHCHSRPVEMDSEVVCHIVSFLTLREIVSCSLLNRKWAQVCSFDVMTHIRIYTYQRFQFDLSVHVSPSPHHSCLASHSFPHSIYHFSIPHFLPFFPLSLNNDFRCTLVGSFFLVSGPSLSPLSPVLPPSTYFLDGLNLQHSPLHPTNHRHFALSP